LNQGDSRLDSYKITPGSEAFPNKASFNLQVVAVHAQSGELQPLERGNQGTLPHSRRGQTSQKWGDGRVFAA
jgi:hypothetical protein